MTLINTNKGLHKVNQKALWKLINKDCTK